MKDIQDDDRKRILETSKNIGKLFAENIEIANLVKATKGFVESEIALVFDEATLLAINRFIEKMRDDTPEELKKASDNIRVTNQNLEESIKKVREIALYSDDINIEYLVNKTNGYVGADIEMLVREAKLSAMKNYIDQLEIERSKAIETQETVEFNEVSEKTKPENELLDTEESKTLETQESEETDEVSKKTEPENILLKTKVSHKDFTTALEKVRGTLDKSAIEEYERTQAWKILFSQEERTVLEKAAGAVQRASFGPKNDSRESAIEELNKLLYAGKKDFKAIREQTEELDKEIKDESQMHM